MAEKLRIEFEGDMRELRAELRKVLKDAEGTGSKGGKKFGSGFSQGFKDAFAGFTAANLATRGIDQAIGLVTTAFDQMLAKEQALADFSAITGITGDALNDFGDAAVALSNKFGTDVLENIDAMKGLLSRLGPGIAQSKEALESMTDTVNVLSKASGLDATASMDALTTAMLQFGVDLSDPVAAASEMSEMMNVMAAGAKEGAAEIPSIAEALKQAGSTAKSLNISFEETNAAIQGLAQAGKFGSEAGVALRNIMVKLTSATGPAEQSLSKMGLTIEQLGEVVTTQGLEAGLKLFNDGLKNIPSLAEQAAIKTAVFGTENLAAAGGILAVVESQGLLTDALGDTNTAYDQAATNMATKSEMMKRATTAAMNEVVSGMEDGVSYVTTELGKAISEIDRTVDAFGKLMRLDVAGFWDTITTSVSDYNREKEEQLRLEKENFEALDKQLKQEGEMHARKAESAKLSGVLVQKLREVEGMTSDRKIGLIVSEFQKLFEAGTINSIDEFFLRTNNGSEKARRTLAELRAERDALVESQGGLLEGDVQSANALNAQIAELNAKIKLLEGGGKKEGSSPLAGTIGALEAEIKEIENRLKNELAPGTEVFTQMEKKLSRLKAELRDLNSGLGDTFNIIELGAKDMRPLGGPSAPLVDVPAVKDQSDKMLTTNELLQAGFDATSISIGMIGETIASAFTGGEDALKSILKAIGAQIITFVEGAILAAEGFSLAEGILSAGATLIKDAPLLAGALIALEAGRGILNSLDVGGFLREDQFIRAHADESVIPLREVPSIWAETIDRAGGSGRTSTRETYMVPNPVDMYGSMRVSYDNLSRGSRNARIKQQRRVG